jgi:CBS domain containing-hemolysin-like protein
VLALLGRLPRKGDRATWNGWELEVAEIKNRRVTRLLARRKDRGQPGLRT